MQLPDLSQLDPILLILGATAALILPMVLFGAVVSALATGGSRFLKASPELESTQAKFDKEFSTRALKPVVAPRNPNAEPFIIAGVGFVIFLALGAFMLRSFPGPKQMEKEEVKAATNALATTGNFSEIVAALPAGNADSGKRQFSAKGCVGCHSLEKDKRLVGPSFYGLYTRAPNAKPGVGAKEYLYESIVKPNEFVVPTYQQGLMPANFSVQLSPQDMSDMLAYIERDHSEK